MGFARYYIVIALLVLVSILPWFVYSHPGQADFLSSVIQNAGDQMAAVILGHNPKSVADIQSHYTAATVPTYSPVQTKVRILLVPGHEPDYGGAEFGKLKERDMNVELADDLRGFLEKDGRYQVFMTRDASAWMPSFADYFKNNWNDIIAWEKASRTENPHPVSISPTSPTPKVYHNTVPDDVATRLYGITKWANENTIDIVIHIHFNDDTEHRGNVPGDHSGFAIYVPERQYLNGTTTRAVAEKIFQRLSKYNPVSDLPGETGGIVEEQDLIAIGANNTADAASMLIEYGYIYEPQFMNRETRSLVLQDMAFQTYLGVQDFFDPNHSQSTSTILPYTWSIPVSLMDASAANVLTLQTALMKDGDYPPPDKSKNTCPRTGTVGACTKAALEAFQKKYKVSGEKGVIGVKTIEALNSLNILESL